MLAYLLWIIHRENQVKTYALSVRLISFSHVFWIVNYQEMDWSKPEVILKVGEGHTSKVDTYHRFGFEEHCEFCKRDLE